MHHIQLWPSCVVYVGAYPMERCSSICCRPLLCNNAAGAGWIRRLRGWMHLQQAPWQRRRLW